MNILFLQVDQLAASSLRAYGNSWCHAPNLDALAAQGTVFENCYCNFPLCAPSRASMATGQLCSRIGAYDNGAELPASIPTYAHYLRAAGYETALSGKMHFIGPDQFHGFERRLTPDLYPADFSWAADWEFKGQRDTNDPRSITLTGPVKSNMQILFDDLVTDEAVEFLQGRTDPRPFFLQASFTHPHEPFMCQRKYWDLYEDVDIPPPRVPPLSEDVHDAHSLRTLKDFGMLDAEFSDEEIARARRSHFGAISYIDEKVGEILTALEASGQRNSTAIVFTADHGEMLGERGIWFKKSFFEDASRVPLFVFVPGKKPNRHKGAVSLLDLLPTFVSLANAPESVETLLGADLTELPDDTNRAVFAEYLAEATPAPIFMIRQDRFKYIWSSADPALLFDLKADTEERTNLATDPNQKATMAEMETLRKRVWNEETLEKEIRLSQKRRVLIRQAMAQGGEARWNHGEKPGQNVPWYRGKGGYNDWAFAFEPEDTDQS